MERKLKRIANATWHYFGGSRVVGPPSGVWGDLTGVYGNLTGVYGNLTGVYGNLTGVYGNLSGVRGDLSGVRGDLSGVSGDLEECRLTKEDRERGVPISELIDADADDAEGGEL